MADYTFPPAVVLVEGTGALAVGATGLLRPAVGANPVPVYDLNGSVIPSVVVGSQGAHQEFTADIPDGVLDFGSVMLVAISKESLTAGLTAADAATSAEEAATSAAQSASAAESSASDAQQSVSGKANTSAVEGIKIHDGTAGGGARPTGYARVRWVNPPGSSYSRPTNMVAGDVWQHNV